MKRILLLFAFAGVAICGCTFDIFKAEAPKRQFWSDDNPLLYGDVESVTEKVIRFENKFGEIVQSDAELLRKYRFNNAGDRASSTTSQQRVARHISSLWRLSS